MIISTLPLGCVLTGGFKPGSVALIRKGTGVLRTEVVRVMSRTQSWVSRVLQASGGSPGAEPRDVLMATATHTAPVTPG